MYKYSRSIVLALFFLIVPIYASVSVRTDDIKNNSLSSDVPYTFHYKKFQPATIVMFNKEDLGQYGGLFLFIGYGMSDKKEQNCYYVNYNNNKNILNDFDTPMVIGKKSYAVSRSRMTYDRCKSLTAKYAGYVYSPFSATEDSVVKKQFYSKKYWVGLKRSNCSSPWKNDYGIEQRFNKINKKNCDIQKLNISTVKNAYSWVKSNKLENNYCVIQIDSKDYLRPIKVCAPWWQIEQSYSIGCKKRINNLTPFMNIAVPKKVSYCTDSKIVDNQIKYQDLYDVKSNWKTTTCSSYYSRDAGESCKDNILQEQCKVNECRGYEEKKCESKGTISSKIKDYEYSASSNSLGEIVWKKKKDKIVIHKYLCPPTRPSIAECKNYKSINIMPTDACQPGGCDRYFSCLNSHTKNYGACDNLKSGCERRYGHDLHKLPNGDVDYALVKCTSGKEVRNYNIDKISETTSKCLKYATEIKYVKSTQKCLAEKTHTEYTVLALLNTKDAYSEKENCVRINNDSANVKNKYFLEFSSSSFYKTRILKVSQILDKQEMDGEGNYTNIIEQLDDGKYSYKKYKNDNLTEDMTLTQLADVFANSRSITIGTDEKSKKILDTTFKTTEVNASATVPVKFDYFKQSWWDKRMYMFDIPELLSISRPYSALAQCLEIPLMKSKSTYGTPFPSYSDGNPVAASRLIKENFESNKYSEQTSDSDIRSKGQYCNSTNNSSLIDWYGYQNTKSNDLYYDHYLCSRLTGNNGKVWAKPKFKTYTYKHKLIKTDGSVKHYTTRVTDRTRVYYSPYVCKQESGATCRSVNRRVNVYFTAYFYSYLYKNRDTNATKKIYYYRGSKPMVGSYSVGRASPWMPASNSTGKIAYLAGMNVNYSSINEFSNFRNFLRGAKDAATTESGRFFSRYLYIGLTIPVYYPSGYIINGNSSSRTESVDFYNYRCQSGYTANDPGYTSYSKNDPNSNKVNKSIFNPPNDNVFAEKSCIINGRNTLIRNINNYLSGVRNYEKGGYCKRISGITEDRDKLGHSANYRCSKYYGSNGEWDYQYKSYYLYNATHFKYFRQKNCGNGEFNKNRVTRSGKNALMLDFKNGSSSDYISKIKRLKQNKDIVLYTQDRKTYAVPKNKLLLADVKNTGTVRVIDKSLTELDKTFELFKHKKTKSPLDDGENAYNVRMLSTNEMSEEDCKKYSNDLNKSRYKVEHSESHSKCIIDFDYFDGVRPVAYKPFNPKIDIKKGSFNFEQTGTGEILAVESYIDGEWGYASNFTINPIKDASVKINNKYIFPIIKEDDDMETTGYITFTRDISQKGTTTRGEIVQTPSSSVTLAVAAFSFAGAALINAGAYIINLFGGKKRYTDVTRNYELYLDRTKYKFDDSKYNLDKWVDEDPKMFIYKNKYVAGTKEKNDGIQQEKDYYLKTEDFFVKKMGIDKDSFEKVSNPAEKGFVSGFNNLFWYEDGPESDYFNAKYKDDVMKKYNMVYYGATNTISIFVPFKGDFEITALDKNANIIGKKFVYATNYLSKSDNQLYQKVYFATDAHFDIAVGIKDGNTDGACRYSLAAEWGGGVSGPYYTYGSPEGYSCGKSNETYVREHSAKYITLRRIGSKDVNVIELKHPMPFANRVIVTTLGKLEKREYSCYQDANCSIK